MLIEIMYVHIATIVSVLCLDDKIGNFEVRKCKKSTHKLILYYVPYKIYSNIILFLFQVGKEFDALLVDVQAPSSTHPVFDVFKKDTFDVRNYKTNLTLWSDSST